MGESAFREPAALTTFHPVLGRWFRQTFVTPTPVQNQAWPLIAAGRNTLLLAPTGSGKTLAAFLVAIDRIMFGAVPADASGVRVLYISPLKALGVDVERNLRSPLVGVRSLAAAEGVVHYVPRVGVRSGDTSARERHELQRHPPDILITTPESLYLMLTSRARAMLRTVDTLIVDEIHSLVSNKRGAHLFLSLERLEHLRQQGREPSRPLQRIGLSATQRPLDEIARLLGGATTTGNPDEFPSLRPVDIIEAGRGKQLELRIEVPVADMAQLAEPVPVSGSAAAGTQLPSIWPAIHPRIVELIRSHRSTMVFVNSRRLAERLAAALNELAGEELVLAHHGSIAKEKRLEIEDKLKRGLLPAIVATSSLELGIDMGAVDLVVQIEAPPSIASGIQRIGRAGHQIDAPSTGVIFPKYRGDLLACAAATARMTRGEVEPTHYPRNPLDVLAQQLVAAVAMEPMTVDRLYALVRGAAPFFDLPRSSFEGVLDLLAGRYPADDFAELRPRVTWDRLTGEVQSRRGAQRTAIANAGTIPDRGLYGVFLAGHEGPGGRVGELDEEMVFETHPGDVFLLGASSWRVVDITHDRVLVVPAPGEPGRMPFWRGEGPGRPLEFGRAIGALTRRLVQLPQDRAATELIEQQGLDPQAARNLLQYLSDQARATGEVPHDRALVVECFLDEVGDWRIAILSPFGARVHVPWAMATVARLREQTPGEVDMVCSDDGIVFRFPESEEPPPVEWLLPAPDEIESLVTSQLGGTALFAARFRENAARALLLPRRQPGRRTPLWLQRRRSAGLLQVAARYPSFPLLLETYRECLRDVFDLAGLQELLRDVAKRTIRVHCVRTQVASPFAASLMFNYVANFLYEGDTPLAERQAQLLALDHAQLRELLGDAEVRELLNGEVIDELSRELQHLSSQRQVRHSDAVHDVLLRLGDLTRGELGQRCEPQALAAGQLELWLEELQRQRRVLAVRIAGEDRFVAAEDAGRFRDALGAAIAAGLPDAFLVPVADPLGDLVSRYARTHGPFAAEHVAARFGLGTALVLSALERLAARGRIVAGEFLPGGFGREWCEVDVLRTLKRRSLARLRRQTEAVAPQSLTRFLPDWQGVHQPRKGLDGLLDVVEQLQGMPVPASDLERDILPRRLRGYRPSDLDELCAAGEIVWRGCDSLGSSDGRIALYLADHVARLAPPPTVVDNPLAAGIQTLLRERGALFFEPLVTATAAFRNDVLDALWELVWGGIVTNDTLAPLRSLWRHSLGKRSGRRSPGRFRSHRDARTPGSEGRWSLLNYGETSAPSATERWAAMAAQLLHRYGVLTREMAASENVAGGFAGLYPVLKAMEEAGKIRRGYFVAGLGAAQFANPGAEDRLRDFKSPATDAASEPLVLAATDPANPYGTVFRWPETSLDGARLQRAAGARVILADGELIGYLGRLGQHLVTFLPESDLARPQARQRLARALAQLATTTEAVFITRIDGQASADTEMTRALQEAGFVRTSRGFLHRRRTENELHT
jgi:ATP-dependent Lhr-like helicase